MKKIHLIRHAITDVHKTPYMLGVTDIPLNEQGRKDAQALAEQLEKEHIQGVICSDLSRTVQTAQIIADHFKVPLYKTEIFRERDQGEYDGLMLPEIYKENEAFSMTTPGEGRETIRQFMKRTKAALQMVADDFVWDEFAVVSHNGLLRTFFAVEFGISISSWPLCEVRTVTYDEKEGWKVYE